MSSRKVRVDIVGDNKKLKSSVKDSEKSLNSFGNSIKKIGGMIAGAFAINRVVSFAKATLQAYDTQAQAENRLLIALKGREDIQQKLIAQAQQLQRTTLFGDEETIQAQALAASMGLTFDQITELIPAAQNLAAAMGQTLDFGVKNLARTYGGLSGELGELIPQLRTLSQEEMKAGKAIELVNSMMAGQAEAAAETGTGGLKQLTDVIGDLQEDIGELLVEGLGLTEYLGKIRDVIADMDLIQMVKNFREFKQENEQWLKIIKAGWQPLQAFNKEFFKFAKTLFTIGKGEKVNLDADEMFKGFMDKYPVKVLEETTEAVKNFDSALRETSTSEGDLDIADSLINIGELVAGTTYGYNKFKRETKETADATEILDGKMAELNKTMEAGFEPTNQQSEALTNYKNQMAQLEQQVESLAASVAGDLAFAFGEAAGGMDGLGDKLAELGIMIASALGDILIAAGVTMGFPAGLPFIAAGLGLKVISGLASGMQESGGLQAGGASSQMSGAGSSMLYGNDIRTSYDYAASNKNRVG